MIKKLGLFFIFIVIFSFINFIHIKSYYYNYIWDKFFIQNDLDKSLTYFLKANNSAWNYNLWNLFYLKWDYDSAINYFNKVSEFSSKILIFRSNHNIWNSYYRIGQKDKENEIKHYKSSLDYYQKALNINFDKETKSNYDFVLDKIKKLEEKNEQEKNEQEKNDDKNQDWTDKTSKKTEYKNNNSSNKNQENSQNEYKNSTWEESNSWEKLDSQSQDAKSPELTQEQIQAIEDYKETLKKEQYFNSEWYNKVYEWENIDIFESFFNNSLLEDDNKKDW